MSDRLLYCIYLIWLAAGFADFRCHRRTSLATTSGLAESSLHLLQIGTALAALGVWLLLQPTWPMYVLLLVMTACHAAVSYLDTKSAYLKRHLSPAEQHLHSVLDIAPWILLGGAISQGVEQGGWIRRAPPVRGLTWPLLIVPGVALCLLPAAHEFYRAVRARKTGTGSQG